MDPVCNEFSKTHVFKWRPFLRQLFVCSAVWVMFFMLGLSYGIPPVTISQLRKEANSTESVTMDMTSWISAISAYTGAVGIFGLGLMTHCFGRMKAVLVATVMSCVGFIVLYCSRNATDVLISQALQGTLSASIASVSLLVTTEYSSPRYRGIFLTIKSATLFWGIWAANAIGAFFNYRNIGLLGIICSVYSIISFFIIPESPYWLASKERYEECAESFRWVNGKDDNTEKELQILINNQKEIKTKNKKEMCVRDHINETALNLLRPEVYKPIGICFLFTCFYYSSGKLVCTIYSIQIIKKITNNESMAYIGMLVLDGFTVLGMYIGCGLSKVLNRRTMLLTASSIGIFFLFLMSFYLYLINYSVLSENHYVTIAFLTCYSVASCCGPIIMLSSIMAEIAPLRSRIFCLVIIAFIPLSVQGTVLKIAPLIFKAFGFSGTFLFFAIMSTIMVVLIYFYLPETKDKTLLEIENLFKRETLTDPAELKRLTKTDTMY